MEFLQSHRRLWRNLWGLTNSYYIGTCNVWDKSYIEELNKNRERAILGGGQKRIDRQHAKGKKTARERLAYLFDEGSFQEVGSLIESRFLEFGMDKRKLPGDGVVIGFGNINGQK